MANKLATYRNGNYDVSIYDDGTKVRDNHRDDDVFDAEFPESIDLNITDYCDIGCPFCYRGCNESGKHADFATVTNIIDSMHPYTEVALGGGSPILYNCESLLRFIQSKNVFANMTVHQSHFLQYFDKIERWVKGGLLHGVGVSCQIYTPELSEKIRSIPGTIVHVIAGVSLEEGKKFASDGCNILILGYKNKGRGTDYRRTNPEQAKSDFRDLFKRAKGSVSFDNLALIQLGVKEFLGEKKFKKVYMGDDGIEGSLTSASMYIDVVKGTFARNSVEAKEFKFTKEPVDEMFKIVKENN